MCSHLKHHATGLEFIVGLLVSANMVLNPNVDIKSQAPIAGSWKKAITWLKVVVIEYFYYARNLEIVCFNHC